MGIGVGVKNQGCGGQGQHSVLFFARIPGHVARSPGPRPRSALPEKMGSIRFCFEATSMALSGGWARNNGQHFFLFGCGCWGILVVGRMCKAKLPSVRKHVAFCHLLDVDSEALSGGESERAMDFHVPRSSLFDVVLSPCTVLHTDDDSLQSRLTSEQRR